MWILFAVGSAFFAGVTAVLSKCGIKNVDTDVATALRTVVVLIFSWMMVFIVGSQAEIFNILAKTAFVLTLSGLATGASWLCYFKALQNGDVNKVVSIDKSSTVLSMILAFIILGEPLGVVQVVSMFLIGIGTYMMIERSDYIEKNKSKSWIIYAILSAVFAALTSILGKIGVENIDSTLGTALRTVVVLLMAWLVVFVKGKKNEVRGFNKISIIFLVLSGVATGASWLCYYRALKTGLVGVVVPIDKLSILVSIVFSYFVFKEKLGLKSLIGLSMIVIGTLLLTIKF